MIIDCSRVKLPCGSKALLPTPPMIPAACTCPTLSKAQADICELSANVAGTAGIGLPIASTRRVIITAAYSRLNSISGEKLPPPVPVITPKYASICTFTSLVSLNVTRPLIWEPVTAS